MICADCGNDRLHYAKGICKPCYQRRWAKENPEKRAAQRRRWHKGHREEHRAHSRRYRQANPDKVAAYMRRYNEANRERAGFLHREYRKRNKEYVNSILAANGCKRCGNVDVRVLIFHHRNASQKNSGVGAMESNRRRRLDEEIAKCDVLCANCHAIVHYDEDRI